MEPNGGGDDVTHPAVAMPEQQDNDAFEDLLRAEGPALRRMVEQVSGSVDPDDVQQEFVLRAYRYRHRFLALPTRGERCAWSRTVARNIAFKMFGETAQEDCVAEVREDALVEPDVLDLAIAGEERRALTDALAALDPGTRHLVVERAVYDTPYTVISEELGQDVSVLRKRYERARETLRLSITRAVLTVVPARWLIRPARPANDVARTAGYPVAVSTVMAGVLAFTFAMPQGSGPLGTPRSEAAETPPPRASLHVPEETTDVDRALGRRSDPVVGSPRPHSVPVHRPGDGPPEPPVRACIKSQTTNVCIPNEEGDDDDVIEGDELYVEGPEPVGRVGVKQAGVKLCDTVPVITVPDVGSAGCERHG